MLFRNFIFGTINKVLLFIKEFKTISSVYSFKSRAVIS